MRFLLDERLPPSITRLLRAAGHHCAHVYELGLGGRPDEQIMAQAARENRILISADTDFGELLANAPVLAPSVILPRRADKTSRSSRRSHPREPRTGRRRPRRRRADRNQRHPHPHTPTAHETLRLRTGANPPSTSAVQVAPRRTGDLSRPRMPHTARVRSGRIWPAVDRDVRWDHRRAPGPGGDLQASQAGPIRWRTSATPIEGVTLSDGGCPGRTLAEPFWAAT